MGKFLIFDELRLGINLIGGWGGDHSSSLCFPTIHPLTKEGIRLQTILGEFLIAGDTES